MQICAQRPSAVEETISCWAVGAAAPAPRLLAEGRGGRLHGVREASPGFGTPGEARLDSPAEPLGVGERSRLNCESLPLEDTAPCKSFAWADKAARTLRLRSKGPVPRLRCPLGKTLTHPAPTPDFTSGSSWLEGGRRGVGEAR